MPEMKKDVIICDLDGTLASMEWRRHFVADPSHKKQDWVSFFNGIPFDAVVPEVKKMLEDYAAQGFTIIYVSARPDNYRKPTMDWLHKHECPPGKLVMRRSNDMRADEKVKQDILNQKLPKDRIFKVIDDRPQVQQMWESNGLDVVKVTDPNIKPAILNQDENTAALLEAAARKIAEATYAPR